MTPRAQIEAAVSRAGPQVHAVLDGAQFDDLPRLLLLGGFISRPLYLDRGENSTDRTLTAPQAVLIHERSARATGRTPSATLAALLDMVADRPAAVFWSCPAGFDALYSHLRGLNMVLYPRGRLPGEEPGGQGEGEDSHAAVLFRHADANVMAQTLPALSPAELARLYGPATAILCAPSPEWCPEGIIDAARPADLPRPPPGMLRLLEASVARIEDRRLHRRERRIAAYLRNTDPRLTRRIAEPDLLRLVRLYCGEAAVFGVRSEAALGRWCYMQVATGGVLGRSGDVKEFMEASIPGVAPDERVRILMRETAAHLAARGR